MYLTAEKILWNSVYAHCDIKAYSPDISDFNTDEQFHLFSLDLFRILSEGHVVNYNTEYRQIKPMRKKLFGTEWLPAIYCANICIENLHNELLEKNYDNCWYAVIETIYVKNPASTLINACH